MDDTYQRLYSSEQKVASLFYFFAGLAILISCQGLFSLTAYTTERRRKEIGVRKVLGSSALNIVRLLTVDFTKSILLAIVISLPLAALIVNSWLADFAYKITLNMWFFLGAGLTVLLIAWMTVGFETIKAALTNPVNSLKNE